MGGVSEKTKIESRMLTLKLRRQRIQDEKKKIIKELEQMLRTSVIREPIPDYINDNRTLKKRKHFYYERGNDPLYTFARNYQTQDYFKKYLNIGTKYKKWLCDYIYI